MDPVRVLLLAALLLVAGPAWAQGPGVKPLERSPHIFYEPQVKYPAQGADEAAGAALPLALGAALAVFAGAFWLTRPLPELEMALATAGPPAPAPAPPPVLPAPPVAALPAVEPPPLVLEEPRPAPPAPARREPVLRLPVAPAGSRMEAPPESPLRRFSWSDVAQTAPLPLVPGESAGPGLVAYLAPAAVRPGLLAATTAALLEQTKGRVVLVATGVTPQEVLARLGGDSPEGLRRHARRLEKLARRLYLPRGGTLTVERLLRAAEDTSAVVVDAASRLEMGSPEPGQWLRDLHGVGSHGGFPVFLVADPGFVPASVPLERSMVFDSVPR